MNLSLLKKIGRVAATVAAPAASVVLPGAVGKALSIAISAIASNVLAAETTQAPGPEKKAQVVAATGPVTAELIQTIEAALGHDVVADDVAAAAAMDQIIDGTVALLNAIKAK